MRPPMYAHLILSQRDELRAQQRRLHELDLEDARPPRAARRAFAFARSLVARGERTATALPAPRTSE